MASSQCWLGSCQQIQPRPRQKAKRVQLHLQAKKQNTLNLILDKNGEKICHILSNFEVILGQPK